MKQITKTEWVQSVEKYLGRNIAMRVMYVSSRLVLVAGSIGGVAAITNDGIDAAVATASETTAPSELTTGPQTEAFLRSASMTPQRAADAAASTQFQTTLSNGSFTRKASVQTVDSYAYGWVESRDSFKYNVAAYRLSKMLGLNVVPCTVWRRVDGRWASVTLAPEEMTATSRRSNAESIFRALTGNPKGDYADAFLATKSIHEQIELSSIDGDLDRKLAALDRSALTREVGEILTRDEIRCLLARRDRILKHCRSSNEHDS